MVAKTDEPFTEILPAVKLRDCTRAIFNSLGDFFTISQPALTDPFGQPGYRFFVAMLIVKNKKPGYSRPLHQNMALDRGPVGGGSHVATEAVPQMTTREPTAS